MLENKNTDLNLTLAPKLLLDLLSQRETPVRSEMYSLKLSKHGTYEAVFILLPNEHNRKGGIYQDMM